MTGAELCLAITVALSMSQQQTKVACDQSEHIVKTSKKHKFDPLLFSALIFHESSFRPRAVSVAGACGLTQVLPRYSKHTCRELKNPRTSITEGARHLGYWLTRAKGSVPLALCGYNAGNRCFTNSRYYSIVVKNYSSKIEKTAERISWFVQFNRQKNDNSN